MARERIPPRASINESLRNNALTAFLASESLILFVAAPLSAIGVKAPLLLAGLLSTTLLLAIVIISSSTGARILTSIATILAVAGIGFRIDQPSLITVWLGHLAFFAALLGISTVIFQAVFAPGRITHHRIAGAVVLYLNLALAFTSIYRLIQELRPGAFAGASAQEPEVVAVSNLLYFSFTTLTSTGFGEILPIDPFARSMANLESVLGQLYLAILLARLVTMHVEAQRK
ncbi:MAG TPA: ion channel [Rhodopila sp.]|jgi:voltage-gated potassium channel Kch